MVHHGNRTRNGGATEAQRDTGEEADGRRQTAVNSKVDSALHFVSCFPPPAVCLLATVSLCLCG